MKKQIFIIAFVVSITCSSCKVVGTLYPLSENENDFLFKKELIGKWGEVKKGSDFYQVDTVIGTKGKLYQATIVSYEKENENKVDTAAFLLRLIKIGEKFFLDCYFDMEKIFSDKEKDYDDWLITKHFFCLLSFNGPDKIEMAFPDPDQLIKLIDAKKLKLDYTELKKDDYLILNKPKELQRGLLESNRYSLLYKDKISLERIKQ